MIQVKYKKNFDIDRMLRNVRASAAVLLNDVAVPVKEGWDKEIKEKIKNWDSGEIGSKMPVLTGKRKNIKYNMKKVNPNLRLKIIESKKKGTYSTEV